jgi:hypothetical protein
MAYQIDRFNRTPLTTVEDGTLNEVTDIKFVGKNYAGYGEVHNENFLFLLESFAGANEPPKPVSGQLWYDSGADRMKFRDGNNSWRTVGGAETSATQPAGLAQGDFWWDTANDQLYVYNGTEFILIGPQDAGDGVTQMVSTTVIDTTDVSRSIIVSYVNDTPIHIISPTEFTIKNVAGNTIDGFGTVRKGITLRDTDNVTGETETVFRFHGTATDSDRLGGFTAGDFIRNTTPEFLEQIEASAAGIICDGVFSMYVAPGIGGDADYGVFKNTSGASNEIKFITKNNSSNETEVLSIDYQGIKPIADGTLDLGTTNLTFNNVYASNFKGVADQANYLRNGTTGSDYRYGSEAGVGSTVAIRTSDNKLVADIFEGTATSARFADLAEKYTVEEQHPVGTVMHVCEHPDHEIEPCQLDSYPVGVTSAEPAYLMNSELTNGQAIALEGRVPVRILGAVKKGQKVFVDANGCASTKYNGNPLVGIALESNSDDSEKLVECILKL